MSPQYGMPMGYISSQTVTPTNVMGAQYTYSDPIVSISSSANISRTNELVPHMSQVPPKSTMLPIGPILDEMFDRYVQWWQNWQRPVGPTSQSSQTGSPQPDRPIAATGSTGPHSHTVSNKHEVSTST